MAHLTWHAPPVGWLSVSQWGANPLLRVAPPTVPALPKDELTRPPLPYFVYFCIFLHISYMFFYIFWWFFWYKIDRVMDGGRLRHHPLINYQFYIKKIIKIYRKTCKKYVSICKNIQNMQKYAKITLGTSMNFCSPGAVSKPCISFGGVYGR